MGFIVSSRSLITLNFKFVGQAVGLVGSGGLTEGGKLLIEVGAASVGVGPFCGKTGDAVSGWMGVASGIASVTGVDETGGGAECVGMLPGGGGVDLEHADKATEITHKEPKITVFFILFTITLKSCN